MVLVFIPVSVNSLLSFTSSVYSVFMLLQSDRPKLKGEGYVCLAFLSHTNRNTVTFQFPRVSWLAWSHSTARSIHTLYLSLSRSNRRLLLRPLHHHHLCKRWSGGDRKPDTSLPVCLQAKLHRSGMPVPAAVHHRAPGLHRKPVRGGVRTQILPL